MLLDARDVHKTYPGENGGVAVLSGVSLQLAAGETLALTGESGSGKSTFLHLLGALDRADSGTIVIGGTALNGLDDAGRAALRRDHHGFASRHWPVREWAADLANRLGLSAVLDRYPESLSGGQQQRVAIARALAGRPSLILADEPTGNLDETSSDAVMALMLELVTDVGAGLLMVTHSTTLAARLSRRVHLSAGRLA